MKKEKNFIIIFCAYISSTNLAHEAKKATLPVAIQDVLPAFTQLSDSVALEVISYNPEIVSGASADTTAKIPPRIAMTLHRAL
jgi:hypothetical protein